MNLSQLLTDGTEKLGLSADPAAIASMESFLIELLRVNEVMNLTAITDPFDMVTKHVLDSLTLLSPRLVPEDASLIDIGCGAGFPGLPLRIFSPKLRLTLLDGTGKRIEFLRKACEQLGLTSVSCIHGRAEELSKAPGHRERYDIATARAVAQLRVLAEYCLPFVKVGGALLAMKGPDVSDELREAEKAVKLLGGRIEEVKSVPIPMTDIVHSIVVIRKISQTSTKYPRISAKIKKSPL